MKTFTRIDQVPSVYLTYTLSYTRRKILRKLSRISCLCCLLSSDEIICQHKVSQFLLNFASLIYLNNAHLSSTQPTTTRFFLPTQVNTYSRKIVNCNTNHIFWILCPCGCWCKFHISHNHVFTLYGLCLCRGITCAHNMSLVVGLSDPLDQ